MSREWMPVNPCNNHEIDCKSIITRNYACRKCCLDYIEYQHKIVAQRKLLKYLRSMARSWPTGEGGQHYIMMRDLNSMLKELDGK